MTYDGMLARDREYTGQGLRLWDVEVHDGLFAAVWRPGHGAQWWAYGDDLEKLIGRDTPHFDNGLRITKLYPYANQCRPGCLNQVLQSKDNYFWQIGDRPALHRTSGQLREARVKGHGHLLLAVLDA